MAMKYHVAYPHPSIRPLARACLCDVDSSTSRSDILKQLYEEYPNSLEDLKLATLWKASDLSNNDVCDKSPQKVYDWINRRGDETKILRCYRIVRLFPDGPHDRSLDKADIVVVTPEILEAVHMYGGEYEYVRARHETLKEIQCWSAPSECVTSASAVQRALNVPHGPRCGRPSDRFGPPTALFSKPLARLKHDLDHLELFTPDYETLGQVLDLVTTSTDFFDDDGVREWVLRPTLEILLPGSVKWRGSTVDGEAKLCGAWFQDLFTYLITEIKNEPGLGGDPFLQGILAYGKVIGQETYVPYLKWSNLPVILLAIAGNRLTVSTAIFTNEIYVDELLSMTLRIGSHGSQSVMRIARVFMAIERSMRLLRDLYSSLPSDSDKPQLPQTIALWPNPTADPPGFIPELEFFAKVDRASGTPLLRINEENERHGMYLARMRIETLAQADASTKAPSQAEASTQTPAQAEGPTQIVFVKFAVQYNEAAHRLLAGQKPPLAPALYFCARVVGDMYMVVMEYIPESKGGSIDRVSGRSPLRRNLPQLVERDISKALKLLHGSGWIFGDLREPNILCLLDSDGDRLLLVDFDTVGEDGVSRYSGLLNPLALLCNGAKRGQIMEKEHDSENLEDLLRRLGKP